MGRLTRRLGATQGITNDSRTSRGHPDQPIPPTHKVSGRTLTNENFGKIRKVYIECLLDKAVTPAQQRIMYTLTPCDKVISMIASHSPFLSSPQELANHLVSIREYEFA
jgi:hypothetical protein